MSMHDADYGSLLINKGNGKFNYESLNGLVIKGESRHVKPITINKQNCFIVVRNNDSLIVITNNSKTTSPLKS